MEHIERFALRGRVKCRSLGPAPSQRKESRIANAVMSHDGTKRLDSFPF
jgi:hypothetical protein